VSRQSQARYKTLLLGIRCLSMSYRAYGARVIANLISSRRMPCPCPCPCPSLVSRQRRGAKWTGGQRHGMARPTLSARVSTICSGFVARITGWIVPVGCASPVSSVQWLGPSLARFGHIITPATVCPPLSLTAWTPRRATASLAESSQLLTRCPYIVLLLLLSLLVSPICEGAAAPPSLTPHASRLTHTCP
jgi:hypothetical protein